MHQIFPTSFALLERTAAAGRSLGRTMGEGAETVAAGGPDLTWLMGMVAVLLAVIAAMAFGFRKVVVGSMQGRAAKRDMRIVDVLPLGGKRQLAVVRCYDRTFALGLGEKSVELIAEMDHEAIEADRVQRSAAKGKSLSVPERAMAFQERLMSAKERLLGAHDLIPGPGRTKNDPAAAQGKKATREAQPAGQEPVAPQHLAAVQAALAAHAAQPAQAALPVQPSAAPTAAPAAPAAQRVGEVSAFVPPAVAPTPIPAQPLGEVAARAGSNREFIA